MKFAPKKAVTALFTMFALSGLTGCGEEPQVKEMDAKQKLADTENDTAKLNHAAYQKQQIIEMVKAQKSCTEIKANAIVRTTKADDSEAFRKNAQHEIAVSADSCVTSIMKLNNLGAPATVAIPAGAAPVAVTPVPVKPK